MVAGRASSATTSFWQTIRIQRRPRQRTEHYSRITEVTVTASGNGSGRRPQFKAPRMSEVVAGILRERIIDGELTDGDLLPKQDELLEEFRISRPSMREALRILENDGLLTVRRGNQGGSVIEVPTADTSAYTFG